MKAGGQGLEVVQLLGCRMLRFVKRAGFDVPPLKGSLRIGSLIMEWNERQNPDPSGTRRVRHPANQDQSLSADVSE